MTRQRVTNTSSPSPIRRPRPIYKRLLIPVIRQQPSACLPEALSTLPAPGGVGAQVEIAPILVRDSISDLSWYQCGRPHSICLRIVTNMPLCIKAMIILYSITGIITALFLGIIITGAVRAHRHPERYGPRRVAGRPRQSRARGIARAMLEGIPIVKFGDEPPKDGVEAAKRDVEMASTDNEGREHLPSPEDTADVHHTTPRETEIATTEHGEDQPSTPAEPKTDAAPVTEAGNFSCPICTDDFIKGQDLRVLPCSHQFHPECVDPWLLTVSGTCPLW